MLLEELSDLSFFEFAFGDGDYDSFEVIFVRHERQFVQL